jgi:hypothetical protein
MPACKVVYIDLLGLPVFYKLDYLGLYFAESFESLEQFFRAQSFRVSLPDGLDDIGHFW